MTAAAPRKTIDLLGFGIAAVDDLVELPHFPEPGTKIDVLARQRQGGGLCTTALVAAARLGLRCVYAGILGDNELSAFVRDRLDHEGVQVAGVVRHPHAKPFHSTILVDRSSGERTILSHAHDVVAPEPEDIDEALIRASRMVFVDHLGPSGTLHACTLARACGVPTVADIERVREPMVRDIMDLVDHLIMPLRLARELTGQSPPEEVVRTLGEVKRACTAITDGVQGCWYTLGHDAGVVRHQPAFPVRVVDTTGCGDVFHGAYAAAIVKGYTVPDAFRFASAAAALKATRPGAQAGAPTKAAVDAYLATGSLNHNPNSDTFISL